MYSKKPSRWQKEAWLCAVCGDFIIKPAIKGEDRCTDCWIHNRQIGWKPIVTLIPKPKKIVL